MRLPGIELGSAELLYERYDGNNTALWPLPDAHFRLNHLMAWNYYRRVTSYFFTEVFVLENSPELLPIQIPSLLMNDPVMLHQLETFTARFWLCLCSSGTSASMRQHWENRIVPRR